MRQLARNIWEHHQNLFGGQAVKLVLGDEGHKKTSQHWLLPLDLRDPIILIRNA